MGVGSDKKQTANKKDTSISFLQFVLQKFMIRSNTLQQEAKDLEDVMQKQKNAYAVRAAKNKIDTL